MILLFQWTIETNKKKVKTVQIHGSCQRAEKAMENEGDDDIICCWRPWNGLQRLGKETGTRADQRKNWDPPDHSTDDISKNNFKSPENLSRLAATQISVKKHQFTMSKIKNLVII